MAFISPQNGMTEVDCHVPEYTVTETKEEIIVVIVAPLSKPKEAAFVLEKNVFTFDSSPYILKIKLPHPVCDRFSQKSYDNDTKTYKIKLKKDLEPLEEDTGTDDDEEILSSASYSEAETASRSSKDKQQFYGFANKYSNMFGRLYDEFSDVVSLPNPDSTDFSCRRELREKEENQKWSDDHYLADTMETEHLESIFSYKQPWLRSPLRDWTDDEKGMLVEIINKSKIDVLSEENIRLSEYEVIEILFGYAYNRRTTEGENTVESGWTINKLSSTLSWFEVFEDLKSVVVSCYRRSLTFPLYRSWKLTEMIHEDVVNLLKAGSKEVTRSLLEVREIFNESENRYILNSLYVNDLCNFAYHMTEKRCADLAEALKKVKVKKYEVNRDLPLLEIGAELAVEGKRGGYDEGTEGRIRDIVEKMTWLELGWRESESEDYESSESSEDGGD